jgi:signal transduction histidine kinase
MLSTRVSRLRDWALFAAAAIMPAIAVGILGLRALSNEADGARREVLLELTTAAERMGRELDQATDRAAAELAAAPALLDGDTGSVAAALAGIAPPFAEPVLLASDRSLQIPAPRAAPHAAPAPPSCPALASSIASSGGKGGEDAQRDFLASCAEAQAATGRWLWPVVALDAAGRGEVPADKVVAWIEAHAGLLSAAERAATLSEAEAALSGALLPRVSKALAISASPTDTLATELRREGAEAAMRSRPDPRGLVAWRAGASAGTLRARGDGRLAGFVVHEGSLERWLTGGERGARAAPLSHLGVRAEVRAVRAGASAERPLRGPELGAELSAMLKVAPELAVQLSPADSASVARHAARGRRLLVGIGGFSMALAFGLAALLFARMRAARRSSELRTDFVAAVSHELRTPIASVRMLAELLEERRVPEEEHREVFEALGREARRLGETVERLLSFRQMASGRQALDRAPASVASAVAASIDTFEERNPEMPRVARDLDLGLRASIDAPQIRLAVDNLLVNARKYAPDGAPYQVRVRRDRGGVAISVEDHGPGIARRDQRRIFEPFERADDRLSRATEGSGIGLSLVRYVAQAHGGRAGVESEPGKGASFTLWIPGLKEQTR